MTAIAHAQKIICTQLFAGNTVSVQQDFFFFFQVFAIPLGGMCVRQPFTIGGNEVLVFSVFIHSVKVVYFPFYCLLEMFVLFLYCCL